MRIELTFRVHEFSKCNEIYLEIADRCVYNCNQKKIISLVLSYFSRRLFNYKWRKTRVLQLKIEISSLVNNNYRESLST